MKKKKIGEEFLDSIADEAAPVKTAEAAPVVMSFDRWFALRGFPAHHKGGLKSFVNTKGKRTVEAWDALFKNY